MKKSRSTRLYNSIIQYLEQNYPDSSLCAAQVALKFNLAEKYVFHIVKEQTGKSFGDYLEGIRLSESEKLLGNTELAISLISEKVGFNSVNTFHKAFKRIYGTSPGAWRSHHLDIGKTADLLEP